MTGETRQQWNAEKYDRDTGFVSARGRGLLPLLDPKPGERILDLGCGTGDLTNEIAQAGAWVTGLDASAEMLRRAEEKYPHLTWILGRAESFRSDAAFDAVFSNAALHWMKQASQVAETVWLALQPGGRFVAEFGGQGNVRAIRDTIYQTLDRRGLDAAARDPWYFPSIGEYAGLLEQIGFQVRYAEHFQRKDADTTFCESNRHS